MALISNHFVRPPYIFKLYLTLMTVSAETGEGGQSGDNDQTAGEHYVVDFRM